MQWFSRKLRLALLDLGSAVEGNGARVGVTGIDAYRDTGITEQILARKSASPEPVLVTDTVASCAICRTGWFGP